MVKKILVALVVIALYLLVAQNRGLWPLSSEKTTLYTNTQYGFELTIPASWQGYTVAQEDGSLYFRVPTTAAGWNGSADMFAITPKTPASATITTGELLGRSATHAFSVSFTQVQPPADAAPALADIQSVVDSFRLTQ